MVGKGYLKPTSIAFSVLDYLTENFPKLIDYKYTAKMEEVLDMVESGKKEWKAAVKTLFKQIVDENINEWPQQKIDK